MHTSPLVSVVISLYNYGRFIEESVRSVLNQTHDNIQLIVVDNGSTDDGAKRLAAIQDGRLEKHTFERNQGISRALNYGFSHAEGEWIAFLPADDRMRPDFIKHMLAVGLSKKCDLVGCWQGVIDAEGKPDAHFAAIYETANNHDSFNIRDFRLLRWENPLNHNLFLWKRSLAEKCMPMQEGVIPCDWGMFLRASQAGCHLEILQEKLLDYRVHGQNLGLRTPSQEYLIHYYYLHLTEYRLTALKIAEDPEAEIRVCHEELVARVPDQIPEPAAQARLILASETGTGTLERWPTIDSFRDYVLHGDLTVDLRAISLAALFSRFAASSAAKDAEIKTLTEERDNGAQRIQRLREELDRAKANVDRLRSKLDAQKAEVKKASRVSKWIGKIFKRTGPVP